MQNNPKIITHFIAGYPNEESSLEIARGLIEGGAFALEIQFPFSDPSADGPVIESACREALLKKFRVNDGFRLVKKITGESNIPVYIMSYASLLFTRGIEAFLAEAKECGVKGLIIPDLIPGADEGLYSLGKKIGIEIIPVIIPSVSDQRLEEIMDSGPAWIYTALRSGITGSYTSLDDSNLLFLKKLQNYKVRVMAGFGIRSAKQITILEPYCEASIVGSYILETINKAIFDGVSLKRAAAEALTGLIGNK